MELDTKLFTPQERLCLRLRQLYEMAGFRQYRMSRFEEYGLYQENRRFLAGEQVITFTDLDGRLLALKPDVTLSIAKNARVEPGTCGKFYYLENVYRPSQASHTFREIRQMGLECIGAVDGGLDALTVSLAMESLELTGCPAVLEVGHNGYVTGLLDALGVPEEERGQALALIRDRNLHDLRAFAKWLGVSDPDGLCALDALTGPWRQTLTGAETLVRNPVMESAVRELRELCAAVVPGERRAELRLNLSLVNDMEYYNGLIFRGLLEDVPRPVLKGGQYDPLAEKFRPGQRAIGFALYLDELERIDWERADAAFAAMSRTDVVYFENPAPEAGTGGTGENPAPGNAVPGKGTASHETGTESVSHGTGAVSRETAAARPVMDARSMVNIALPKGRLADKVMNLLAGAGYGSPAQRGESRKLVIEDPAAGIRYFLVKPSDVAIYVEHGAADVGIVGKDILEETGADVYELLDLGLGRCRMCVAGPEDYQDEPGRTLRVATKFVNIAKRYYASLGRDIDVIQLHGSIELAPLLGLSDVIVDIVETGTTLRENRLRVVTEFLPISARFIANRSGYVFKREAIERLLTKLREVTAD